MITSLLLASVLRLCAVLTLYIDTIEMFSILEITLGVIGAIVLGIILYREGGE